MLKVFMVEDESVIRDGLRDRIPWEQYGYQFVGEAADGEMALPLIRKLKPDVLITDIKMPFMDGLSLSKIISAEFPKMKIIIISGYDDFEYARQAIEVGVEQYLLKPITKTTLRKVLLELKEKIEQDMEQGDYQKQFRYEMHEYEQFSRRYFFEKVLEGDMAVKDIYEESAKLEIELTASCYNLLFFQMQEKSGNDTVPETDKFIHRQEEILHYFMRYPQYVLFAWGANCYGVLIKAEKQQVEEYAQNSIDMIRKVCSADDKITWYVAGGEAVERLSMLTDCYQKVHHYFAYRFILPDQHIFSAETLKDQIMTGEENEIGNVDVTKMDPEIIKEFLSRGRSTEIGGFVDSYLQSIHDALESRMFRDYIVLNIRFAVTAYMESIGTRQEEYSDRMEECIREINVNMKPEDVKKYFAGMLKIAIEIRDEESDYQSGKVLRKALEYIDAQFDKETLSLNSVAGEVGVSSNYLSTIFSQSMQKTFIEYVTTKRMEKAKKMLRSTDKSSGEIALEVGYKDPHYFSFVFKKTQGMSPREYRTGKKS